ncbi:hypothetical protein ACP70R_022593 [Stipagrostis hirtigluma subsp. patula]
MCTRVSDTWGVTRCVHPLASADPRSSLPHVAVMPGTPPPSSSAAANAAKQAEAERAKKAEADRVAEAECAANASPMMSAPARPRPSGTLPSLAMCCFTHALRDTRNLHIWIMFKGWCGISEEYVIPSLENMDPSILELRRMSKAALSLWVMMAQAAFVCV